MMLHKLAVNFRTLSMTSMILVLSILAPLGTSVTSFAAKSACTPSRDSNITRPAGADASTYTYNCSGQYAGEWTNPYYVFNPATSTRTPLYAPDYIYDCTTKTWSMVQWVYSPAKKVFISSRITPESTPNLVTNCPTTTSTSKPNTTSALPPSSTSNTTSQAKAPMVNAKTTGSNSIGSAVTPSTNNGQSDNSGILMTNSLTTNANTGNAYVVMNTNSGSATSGTAQAISTVANMLQSTSNAFGPSTTMFTANINGDVNGDFMFNPSAILATGPSTTSTSASTLQTNVAASTTTNARITNNIDVGATSGDATVSDNTTAGNATSGNADAVVNLMNLINSSVDAGQSFIGTININGDLNGNILLPQGTLNQLLASAGSSINSNNTDTNISNTNAVHNNVTEAVTNAIHSTAISGAATVSDNTTAGNATSGKSSTNVTFMNLTNSSFTGKNSLLIYVNVLGKWVGIIMGAPPGSNVAELGSGPTSTDASASSGTTSAILDKNTVNNNIDLGIINNVNLHATSGDATVSDNTTAGNATTGNAQTAVNILNMLNSSLSLSNWFGVLFINVFGTWNGNFGMGTTTSADGPTASYNLNAPTKNPIQAATQQKMLADFQKRLASFKPRYDHTMPTNSSALITATPITTATAAFETHVNPIRHIIFTTTKPSSAQHDTSYLLPIIGFIFASLIILTGERKRLFDRKH